MRVSDFMSFTYYEHSDSTPNIDTDSILRGVMARVHANYPGKQILLHEVGCGTDSLLYPGKLPVSLTQPDRDVPYGEFLEGDFVRRLARTWAASATIMPLLAWFVPFDWPIGNRDGSGCNTSTTGPITGGLLPAPITSQTTTDPPREFLSCDPCADALCNPCRWGDALAVASNPNETAAETRYWNVYFASCGLVDAAGRPKYAWDVLVRTLASHRSQLP